MVIVVGGIKGGTGKTTVAINFAVMRAAQQRDVLLIDADEQGTASDFAQLRAERLGSVGYTSIQLGGPAVRTQTMRLCDKYQDVIIDTGGRDTTSQRAALTVADLLLVPFVPRSFDLWTLEKVVTLVEEVRAVNQRLQAATFLNRADARGQDNAEAAVLLREAKTLRYLDCPIGSRKAFGNAAAAGLAVVEMRRADEQAAAEITALCEAAFSREDALLMISSGKRQAAWQ